MDECCKNTRKEFNKNIYLSSIICKKCGKVCHNDLILGKK